MATGGMTISIFGRGPKFVGRGLSILQGYVALSATSTKTSTIEKYFRRCHNIEINTFSGGLPMWKRSATHKYGLMRLYGFSAAVTASSLVPLPQAMSGVFMAVGVK